MLESGSGTISAWMCPTLPTRNLACGTGSSTPTQKEPPYGFDAVKITAFTP
jgi:hypothetical protein